MGFKAFVAIYLSIITAVSTFVVFAVPRLQTQNEVVSSNHLSVRWMGFAPSYSNQYPEYYTCINRLADPMTLPIAIKINNQENRSFYFKIAQSQAPPSGWSLWTYNIGFIDRDETREYVYEAFRGRPTSLPQGKLTETIDLAVKAYYDSAYTQFYSQDSFAVKFNFLDRTAAGWTTLYNDNFDDGKTHEWVSTDGPYASSDYYRSFQYSLKSSGSYLGKSFGVYGAFSEAYIIYSVRSNSWTSTWGIQYNGTQVYKPDLVPSTNTWYQIALSIPVGQTTEVTIDMTGTSYLDDVYVIAK